jgi:hypothetical protein
MSNVNTHRSHTSASLDLLRENSDPANYFLAQRRTLTVTLVTLSESI